ncbi:hypothetical protein ACIP02_24175 [Pseudomonas sp. NPDC089408]|uniref:hypothetical protein n=1 Tax=Pseudomonas sp. NPDC089408 TaxID=3364465 RepID=UPI0037FE4658
MRIRGNVYWTWVDPTLHHRSHEETLDGGVCIDVQVRLSRRGVAQMFVGVYARSGMALHEEAFYAWPKASQARALAWGVVRARGIAETGSLSADPAAWSEAENIKPGSTRCTG